MTHMQDGRSQHTKESCIDTCQGIKLAAQWCKTEPTPGLMLTLPLFQGYKGKSSRAARGARAG